MNKIFVKLSQDDMDEMLKHITLMKWDGEGFRWKDASNNAVIYFESENPEVSSRNIKFSMGDWMFGVVHVIGILGLIFLIYNAFLWFF